MEDIAWRIITVEDKVLYPPKRFKRESLPKQCYLDPSGLMNPLNQNLKFDFL